MTIRLRQTVLALTLAALCSFGLRPVARAQSTAAGAIRAEANGLTARFRGATTRPARALLRRTTRSAAFRTQLRRLAVRAASLGADTTAQERLRTAGAVARTLAATHDVDAGALTPILEAIDRLDAALADARYATSLDAHESAVELEVMRTGTLLEALTTADGTVGPVLREGTGEPPQFLVELAADREPASVRWDELDTEQKLELLRSQVRGRDFYANRRIPGVAFRRAIANRSGAPLRVGGRVRHGPQVDVSDALMDHVEITGPDTVATLGGVEIHVREHGDSGATLQDAAAIAELLEVPRLSVHQHITVHAGPELLRGDATARVGLVDFYRRTNILAELDVVADGRALAAVEDNGTPYFDYLHAEQLGTLDRHLASLGNAELGGRLGHDDLKNASVGFRTGELYGDQGMFGFELRAFSTSMGPRQQAISRAVQRALVTRRYGIARSTIAHLVARLHRGALGAERQLAQESAALEALHYNRSTIGLLATPPQGVRISEQAAARVLDGAEQNYALKMLVHDWSNDPVLVGRPGAIAQVRRAQNAALRALGDGVDAETVMREFVGISGLREEFGRSIGLEPRGAE